jgi:hypothetical protein
MSITFEEAVLQLENLDEDELRQLAKLKMVELLFGFTSQFLGDEPICSENLSVMREVYFRKKTDFFGYDVYFSDNVWIIVQFMASQRRETTKSGKYSKEFIILDQMICFDCAEYMMESIDEIIQKVGDRFIAESLPAAQYHIEVCIKMQMISFFLQF